MISGRTNMKTITSILIIICLKHICAQEEEEFCQIDTSSTKKCGKDLSANTGSELLTRYLLYDVNPPEGFNLRRDVYMRLAIFIRSFKKYGRWKLVLPPWNHLYHWQSTNVGQQLTMPWMMFFDVSSLQKFAPVIELGEYLTKVPKNETPIDEIYVLQHFKDMWEEGKVWKDQWKIESCHNSIQYSKVDDEYFGPFWGYDNITAKLVSCVSFQGHASLLQEIFEQSTATSIMIDHAEVALHDVYGDRTYWQARRSMRFASHLVEIAANFRNTHLNSTDEADGTERPPDWREEKQKRNTLGGPYLSVHLRRKDFLWGRSKEVPDLKYAAKQLEDQLLKHNLDTIFVATDAPKSEFAELKSYLFKFKVFKFDPPPKVKVAIKDGGLAIVDQIICANARYFIGTHESTFSFRIQEEREIMGFNEAMTFNRLCGNSENVPCTQPTRWRVVF